RRPAGSAHLAPRHCSQLTRAGSSDTAAALAPSPQVTYPIAAPLRGTADSPSSPAAAAQCAAPNCGIFGIRRRSGTLAAAARSQRTGIAGLCPPSATRSPTERAFPAVAIEEQLPAESLGHPRARRHCSRSRRPAPFGLGPHATGG